MKIFSSAFIVSILAFTAGYFWWLHPGYEPLVFSSEQWMTSNSNTRGHMADSLLDTHGISGLSQQEVINLLGYPNRATTTDGDWVEHPEQADELAFKSMKYLLGYRGYREEAPMVLPYILSLTLKNGVVSRVWIHD